jgi:hypothetical protein
MVYAVKVFSEIFQTLDSSLGFEKKAVNEDGDHLRLDLGATAARLLGLFNSKVVKS